MVLSNELPLLFPQKLYNSSHEVLAGLLEPHAWVLDLFLQKFVQIVPGKGFFFSTHASRKGERGRVNKVTESQTYEQDSRLLLCMLAESRNKPQIVDDFGHLCLAVKPHVAIFHSNDSVSNVVQAPSEQEQRIVADHGVFPQVDAGCLHLVTISQPPVWKVESAGVDARRV